MSVPARHAARRRRLPVDGAASDDLVQDPAAAAQLRSEAVAPALRFGSIVPLRPGLRRHLAAQLVLPNRRQSHGRVEGRGQGTVLHGQDERGVHAGGRALRCRLRLDHHQLDDQRDRLGAVEAQRGWLRYRQHRARVPAEGLGRAVLVVSPQSSVLSGGGLSARRALPGERLHGMRKGAPRAPPAWARPWEKAKAASRGASGLAEDSHRGRERSAEERGSGEGVLSAPSMSARPIARSVPRGGYRRCFPGIRDSPLRRESTGERGGSAGVQLRMERDPETRRPQRPHGCGAFPRARGVACRMAGAPSPSCEGRWCKAQPYGLAGAVRAAQRLDATRLLLPAARAMPKVPAR